MNETFTNEDEAREIFGRLKLGVALKLGEQEYVLRGKVSRAIEGAFVPDYWLVERVGDIGGEVRVTLESILATLNAGLEVKIVEAADNSESKAPEEKAD